jgi:hypothetical protein
VGGGVNREPPSEAGNKLGSEMMRWIIAISAVMLFIVGWICAFRSVMKNPNNGNEFSRDQTPPGA